MPLLRVMAGSRSFGALLAAFILAACVHALCAQFIRAEGHTTLYAVQGLLNTALYIALNVLFLTVFRWGVMGYLLSTVAADCLSALFLICRERLWRQLRPAPRAAPWRQMLAYCVPLIPTAVFWWIMGVSDRYLVKWLVGSDANGIYAVAYKIPTILTILATVFMDAWQLSAIAESGDRRAQARFYARVWDAFFSAACLCAGSIIAFSPLLIRLLAAESYYDAWRYIPILTLSMIAAAFSNFMGSVYVVTKKSTASLWISLAGAAANIALDLLLIPRIGVQGAAAAMFLGCLLVFLMRTVSARRLLPFRLAGGKLALGALVLLVQTAAMLLRPRGWLAAQGVSLIVLFILALRPMLAAAQTVFQRKWVVSMILTVFHGFCMALADSVPGVSGGTIAFIPFIAAAERTALKRLRSAPFALFGMAVVVGLTLLRGSSALGSVSFALLSPLSLLYIFLSGAVAITAMVLPGILGSSILLIAGVYLPAIQAVHSFLHMELSVLPGLFALGFGVLAGVALSIHAIRTTLHKYRSEMVWLILGLMLGSLYAIVYGAVNLTVPLPPMSLVTLDAPAPLLAGQQRAAAHR